jgi:hypothetical protein
MKFITLAGCFLVLVKMAVAQSFTSSNLPIVIISTGNVPVVDDPKHAVDFKIIDNGTGNRNYLTDPPNNYNGRAGIETRGSSSQMFPKKTYGIELWDSADQSINHSLCGMPAESDWILSASYSDKTLMRNPLAYMLSSKMGHYASRNRYVEVVLDGQYLGVYSLMEKVKRDSARVDISKLKATDLSGDQLTGGYIFKLDRATGSGTGGWTSNYPAATGNPVFFLYEYPSDANIQPAQQQYLAAYVDSFESAINNNHFDTVTGYRRFFSMNAAIDYFLITELSRNADGYRLSTFMHKDRNSKGGKIKMGPVWDYDLAFRNSNGCNSVLTTGWAYLENNYCDFTWYLPAWWDHLMQDTNFTNRLRCRWEELRGTILSTTYLDQWIDSTALYLNESQQRNFTAWPILGQYVWPNPYPIPQTYQGEIDTLKSWIHNRIAWLDANMPGTLNGCNLTSVQSDDYPRSALTVYPNPAQDRAQLLFDCTQNTVAELHVCNMLGQELLSPQKITVAPGPQTLPIDLHTLPAGLYVIRLRVGDALLQEPLLKTE